MSVMKQSNPVVDFGFHAVIPRIIRTGFKRLTAMQKWLYVCLKDLCGNHGTCYRSLRILATETGISTGMLSESIPVLHECGLIHAEKKKRTAGGKEVWHISIVDIWGANAKAHPTKRSSDEQIPEDHDQNVQTLNKNVHTVNENSPERSDTEQKRSHSETEVIGESNKSNEAIREKQDGNGGTANAGATNHTHSPSEQPENKSPRVSKDQYDAAFKVIDETLQILHNNSEVHVPQGKVAKESVKALILAKGSPKLLGLVIKSMWNEKNREGDYWWREPGRMTVKAICDQYASRAPHLAQKLASPATTTNEKPNISAVEAMQTALIGVSGLPLTRSNGQKLRVLPPERKPRFGGRKAV